MAKRLPDIFEEMRTAVMKSFGGGAKAAGEATPGEDPVTGLTDAAVKGTGGAYRAARDGIKGFGADTLKRTADEFNETLPYIQRAGYDVTAIEVGLGLNPKITSELRLVAAIDQAEQQALLDEVRGRTLRHTILSALFSAAAVRNRLRFNRFHFAALELEVSILPTVSLKFYPDHPEAVPEDDDGAALVPASQGSQTGGEA